MWRSWYTEKKTKKEVLMATIELIKNTCKICTIILESKEVCSLNNCTREQACPGKSSRRDNKFTCNLQELLSLYRKAAERNKK